MRAGWCQAGWIFGGLLLAAGASAAPQIYPFQAQLKVGQLRSAMAGIRAAIDRNPDEPDLFAWLGIAVARAGAYAEALPAFELAVGSEIYDQQGIAFHADALRATGQPERAAALRRERLVDVDLEDDSALLWIGIAEDLEAAGDLEGAWEAMSWAESVAPSSANMLAAKAELELQLGEPDEAAASLWLASLSGGGPGVRERLAGCRLARQEGDLAEASRALGRTGVGHRKSRLGIYQAELLREAGAPARCLEMLDQPRFLDRERPIYLAVRMACAAEAGELAEAKTLRDHAMRIYPRDADVLSAAAIVDGRGGPDDARP